MAIFSIPSSLDKKPFLVALVLLIHVFSAPIAGDRKLRFGDDGEFKILQVADMHYADGEVTPCKDVLPDQVAGCSDLNTTAFLHRIITAEKPDLIVFTDNQIETFILEQMEY